MEMQMETIAYAFTQVWVCKYLYLNQRFALQKKMLFS